MCSRRSKVKVKAHQVKTPKRLGGNCISVQPLQIEGETMERAIQKLAEAEKQGAVVLDLSSLKDKHYRISLITIRS